MHSLSHKFCKMHTSGYTNKWEISSDGGFYKMQSKSNYLKRHNEVSQGVYFSKEVKMVFLPLKVTLNAPNKKVITKLLVRTKF